MSEIRIDTSGAVDRITLCRPEKRNALNDAMLAGLLNYFSVAPDISKRGVVIAAEGPAYCAGLDLSLRDGSRTLLASFEEVMAAMDRYPLPIVACVQGDAAAGGIELAFHSDLVIALNTAKFSMPLAQLSLAPTWLLTRRLIDIAGPTMARRMLYLGDGVTAAELQIAGAIAFACGKDELAAGLYAIVDRLSKNAPLSLRAMKLTVGQMMARRTEPQHDDVDREIERVRTSEDAKRALAARKERRTPTFLGE